MTTATKGSDRDTLRCLTLETIDKPLRRENMDLDNSRKFITYEVKCLGIEKNERSVCLF